MSETPSPTEPFTPQITRPNACSNGAPQNQGQQGGQQDARHPGGLVYTSQGEAEGSLGLISRAESLVRTQPYSGLAMAPQKGCWTFEPPFPLLRGGSASSYQPTSQCGG